MSFHVRITDFDSSFFKFGLALPCQEIILAHRVLFFDIIYWRRQIPLSVNFSPTGQVKRAFYIAYNMQHIATYIATHIATHIATYMQHIATYNMQHIA